MASKPQRKVSKSKQRKASLATSPNINREPKISFQQRINPIYLQEESQVEKLIESRKEKIHEETQTDLEILFFTDRIPASNVGKEQEESDTSLKSLPSTEVQSARNQYPDSLVQIEEDKLFERVKEQAEVPTDILYYPSSDTPVLQSQEKTENPTRTSQGIYEAPLNENIVQRNKNLLYNRLLEEGKSHLFDSNGELPGLKDQNQNIQQLMRFESTKEFPLKFVLVDEDELISAGQLEETSVLVIKVGRLHFHHHHLFSEEHFLARTIEKSYQEYSVNKKSGTSELLLQRIAFLKNAMAQFKRDSGDYKTTLTEILELRNKFHLERKAHADRIRNILEDYKALKNLRKTQQFNLTSLKLIISVDESSANDQSRFLEDHLEEETQETFELDNLEYQEIKRDRKQRRKSLTAEELENLPSMPAKPILEKIKSKLRKKYKDCHFDVRGRSAVDILLTTTPRTPPPVGNIAERKRISCISGVKFHLKVFCNNEPIGIIEANGSLSDESFIVPFNSAMSLRLINRPPDQIRIDLIEQRPLKGKLKLSKISVPVPRIQQGSIDSICDYSQLEFVSARSVQSDVGIGAGQFCIRKNHQQHISGSLAIKIGWKEAVHCPDMAIHRVPRIMSRDSQFDPMNPDQVLHLDNVKDEKDDDEDQEKEEFYFNEDELAFCSLEELRNNPRNRILSERAKNNVKYRDFKLVPYNERQLEETLEEPVKILDETLGMDPIDLQRFKGKKYLTEVYSKISNYCKSLTEECDENLLMDNMPTIASLIHRFFDFFSPNRPLKPVRRQPGGAHRLSSRSIEVSQFKISVNIVRAFGIPQRQDDSQYNTRKSSNMSSPKDPGYRSNIRPFVTATFRDVSMRTSTGDGSNPTWNEQMTIPLK